MLNLEARAEIITIARRDAHDYYLSALLGQPGARDDLLVLAAFEGELSRIIATVADPILAEIRLQWWSETVAAMEGAHQSGHPVADALSKLVTTGRVSTASLARSIDARSADTGADPITTDEDLDRYLDSTEGAALARSIAIITAITGIATPPTALIEAAGRSVGLVRVLLELPRQRAMDRPFLLPLNPIPTTPSTSDQRAVEVDAGDEASRQADQCRKYADSARRYLDDVRQGWAEMSRWHRAALGPVALVGPYLKGLQRVGYLEPHPAGVITPISRVARLWWAVRFARA